MSQLFIGWGTSPVLAMLAASILFFLVRTFVMHSDRAYQVCNWVCMHRGTGEPPLRDSQPARPERSGLPSMQPAAPP